MSPLRPQAMPPATRRSMLARYGRTRLAPGVAAMLACQFALAFVPLQQPTATLGTPANVLFTLSVEFPTGLTASYPTVSYNRASTYVGYFDPKRCYAYISSDEYFQPNNSLVQTDGSCASAEWSGNVLNWLTATNLDQFRKVMTGGARDTFSPIGRMQSGDTTDRTVLIKANSNRNFSREDTTRFNPVKVLDRNTPGVPQAVRDNVTAFRTLGYGTKMLTAPGTMPATANANWDQFPDMTPTQISSSCGNLGSVNGLTSGEQRSCFNIRVRVCDISQGKSAESNCNAGYSGQPKPEGLVQEYADRLRYGAMGYLQDDTQERDGGVLRAPLRSVGASKVMASGIVGNDEPEWNLTTGVLQRNPNPADATASGVGASGLINYINQFGFASGYKDGDPVSELYYAALMYLRGLAPPSNYASDATAAHLDGFPAVTGNALQRGESRDPMVNTCQRSFIIGLGDIFTSRDGRLPGSTNTNDTSAGTKPTDPSINVQALWETVHGLEDIAANGWVGGQGDTATPYVAGLAHWAHTNDIRPDLDGLQTVETFWVDVLENSNGTTEGGGRTASENAIRLRTQYWLAAKYGGFNKKLAGGNNPKGNIASWDSNNDGVPDNLFAGNDPISLSASLNAAFEEISTAANVGTASAPAVSQRVEGPGTLIFSASYDPSDWTGELRACRTSQTAEECRKSPVWNASDWLRPENAPVNGITPLKPAERKIITAWRNSATGAFAKSPFLYSPPGPSINSAQRALINGDDSEEFGKLALAFLRGDRSREGRELRRRGPHALASIVNSNITYLGRSTERYSGPNFQGNLPKQDHKTYRDTTTNRAPVVYVGANDGKLHAFDATNGKELFAYVPGSMFFNDKLNAQVQPNFSHQYMLDSTPMVGDFQNSSNSNRWGTLLVGGLGGGGRGFYALNITRQAEFAGMNENLLASELPLWEFTSAQDPDVGYTYNEPAQDSASGRFLQIAKVASASVATGSWVVALGNGYGSTNGKAVLYLLNAATGVAQHKLEVPAIITSNGEPPPANGLSTPTPVDTDGDGLVDTIYAGDLLGYVHKFAYTRTQGTGNAAKWVLGTPGSSAGDTAWRYIGAVFRAVDNAGNPQPITTAIAVGPRCGAAGGLALSVGTGKLLERTDVTSTSPQMFFTFFDTGAVTPGSPKTPLLAGPDNLATLTTEQGRTTVSGLDIRNWAAPTGTTAAEGWKMPLQAGERVLGNATLPPDTGAVVFGVTQPRANTCGADGGYVVAVDLCSGSTTTLTFDGQLVGAFKVGTNGVVKVAPGYRTLDGKLFAGSNQPPDPETTTPTTGTLADNLAPPGRYSWREVLGF